MRNLILFAVLALALSSTGMGQSLTTTFAGGNGQDGNMFDLVALNNVVITGFDCNLDAGTLDVEVYTCNFGSYVGHESNPMDWTLVGTAVGVVSTGNGAPGTPLGLNLQIPIPACTTQGFYITVSLANPTTAGVAYTNGTSLGSVFAEDANLQFLEGIGNAYPFGGTFIPRLWNGTINYIVTTSGGGEYQLNQAGSSLDVNGLTGNPCNPIQATFSANTLNTLNLSSTSAGMPWDIALTIPEPSVPASAGGVTTPNGQIVNVNVLAPSFSFLNPGFPFVSASLPLVLPQIQLTAQMVVVDPALPDAFALSAVNEINSVGCQNPENFDGLTAGTGTPPLGWTNGALGTVAWTVGTGTTTSSNTGPLTGAFSAPNYMYCETSVPNSPSVQFLLDTCAIDVTTLSAFTLDFRLSRLGATIGTLNIYQDDGGGFGMTPIATYTGPEPLGMDWTPESIPFTPAGATVAFRFDYTSGSSFSGDIAIDDVAVQ